MLSGRTKELTILENLYNSNSLNVVFLDGETGSDLNELLIEFAARKKTAYYKVRQSTENSNEAAFALEIAEQGFGNGTFDKWEEALEQVCKKSLGEKIVIIVTEANLLSCHFKNFTGRLLEIFAELGARIFEKQIQTFRKDI